MTSSSQSNTLWWKSERAMIAVWSPAPSAVRKRTRVFGPWSAAWTAGAVARRHPLHRRLALAQVRAAEVHVRERADRLGVEEVVARERVEARRSSPVMPGEERWSPTVTTIAPEIAGRASRVNE
jgi:hypothetical protein